MNPFETKIKESFERHERDVTTRPGAWGEVERRIGSSRRRRVVAATVGAALAIAGALVAIPRIGRQTAPPVTSNWKDFRAPLTGVSLQMPPHWTARENGPGIVEITPPEPLDFRGKPLFELTTSLEKNSRYVDRVGILHDGRKGFIGNRPYVRYETRLVLVAPPGSAPQHSVMYRIDWPEPGGCPIRSAGCTPYTLVVQMGAQTEPYWTRYGATAERIVSTMRPYRVIKPGQPHLLARLHVQAFRLAAGPDSVWALAKNQNGNGPGQLTRIDGVHNRVLARIDVGTAPVAVAADASGVWVANGGRCASAGDCSGSTQQSSSASVNNVMRIDPSTNKVIARIAVIDPLDIAVGEGSVWVSVAGPGDPKLLRIDPSTNTVVHTSNLHRTPGSANIAVGDGYVWIAQGTEEGGGMWFVSRLDPSTYDFRALTFDTGFSTTQPEVAVGPGALWVTRGGTHSASALERLSPDPFNAVTAFDLPDGAPVGLDAVTVGEGYVWATSARGYLWKVDLMNKFLGDPTLVGDAPPIGAPDVVAAFGFVWVASDDGQIWQYAA